MPLETASSSRTACSRPLLILIGVPFMSLMCFTAYLIRRRFRMQLEASANHETSSNKPPRTYVV